MFRTWINDLRWSRNDAISRREHAAGSTVLRARPQFLIIDPSSMCNARCVMCPVSFRTPSDRGAHLPPSTFGKLGPIMPAASHINLFATGEPTVAPDLVGMVRQARRRSTSPIWVGSNGKRLPAELLEVLAAPGMGLQLSVDGGTREVFESIRRGIAFDELCHSLELATSSRRACGFPMLSFSCTMSKRNIHDLAEIFALGERFAVDHLIVYDQDPEVPEEDRFVLDESDRAMFEAQLPAIEATGLGWSNDLYFRGPLPRDPPPPQAHSPLECLAPWKVFYLRADGEVRTCCTLRSSMGNLGRSSFEEVWNGDAYVALRRAFATQHDIPAACLSCTDGLRTYSGVRSRPWLATLE